MASAMRIVKYKTHWSYLGPGVQHEGLLAEFILDMLYLMEHSGVLPPLAVLNQVLQRGGNSGGMGPGTTWKPFTITKQAYDELVAMLLTLEVAQAKQVHPYLMFERVIIDQELDACTD